MLSTHFISSINQVISKVWIEICIFLYLVINQVINFKAAKMCNIVTSNK